MVLLDSDHTAIHVRREMDAYSSLCHSWQLFLLVQDGIIDTLPVFAAGRAGTTTGD